MKKRILSIALFISIVITMLPMLPKETSAESTTEYISDMSVLACDDSYPNFLHEKKFTTIFKDLNAAAGGKYIYAGYKKTKSIDDAITDIITWQYTTDEVPAATQTVNSIKYNLVKGYIDRKEANYVNLNSGTGGKYIYFYYTKDKKAGEPITQLDVDGKSYSYFEFTVCNNGGQKACDLNAGAEGDYVYMHYKRNPKSEVFVSLIGDTTMTIRDGVGGDTGQFTVCVNKSEIAVPYDQTIIITGTSTADKDGSEDCRIDVKATKAPVHVSLRNVGLRCDDGSPLEVWNNATLHLTLDGRNRLNSMSLNRAGLCVKPNAHLYIYDGTYQGKGGSLDATGDGNAAGIGGNDSGENGYITINGGTIRAYCNSGNGAGIGCGGNAKIAGKEIVINGGTIDAESRKFGAGIGGASFGPSGPITINGGNVTARSHPNGNGASIGIALAAGESYATAIQRCEPEGFNSGAGIGSGYKSTACGNITINGGTVTATGYGGAGIGSGGYSGYIKAHITINGGYITAVSDSVVLSFTPADMRCLGLGGSAIGGGFLANNSGTVTINGGTVLAKSYQRNGDTDKSITGKVTIIGGNVLSTEINDEDYNDTESIVTTKNKDGKELQRYTIKLSSVKDNVDVSGLTLQTSTKKTIEYGVKNLNTTNSSLYNGNSAIYVYLPKGTDLGRIVLADGTTYVKSTTDNTLFTKELTYPASVFSYGNIIIIAIMGALLIGAVIVIMVMKKRKE